MKTMATAGVLLLLTACSTAEVYDTNARVDARPECGGPAVEPGGDVAPWCEREWGVRYSSDDEDGEPIDFSGDDPPR